MSKLSHITLPPLNTKTVEYAKGYSKYKYVSSNSIP